ncbi:ABC transporter permease [Thalassotalea fusca]
MTSNNLLFDVQCEWRRWRGQYAKLSLLLLGFALLSALLAIALRLGVLLFDEAPQWTNTQAHLYTIGQQHKDGRLEGVNRLTIDATAELGDIENVNWFIYNKYRLDLNQTPLPETSILTFDPQAIDALGIDLGIESPDLTQGAWISERFWREHLKSAPNLIGQYLHNDRIPNGIIIHGILPKQLNKIGPWQPDIWMPAYYLKFRTPFSGDMMVDRFLRAAPFYFGVISASKPISPAYVVDKLNSMDLTVKGMSMRGSGSTLTVLKGINFDPVAHNGLTAIWQLLLLLIIGLGLVLTLNFVSVCSSRAIMFNDDFRILKILGSTNTHLLKTAAITTILKLVIIMFLSGGFTFGIARFISQLDSYQLLVGSLPLSIASSQLFSAWVLIALILFICTMLPFLKLRKQSMFSRLTNTSLTFMQRLTGQCTLVFQLAVALIALNVTLTIAYQQWLNSSNSTVAMSSMQLVSKQKNQGLAWQQVVNGEVPQISRNNVAVATASFDNMHAELLEDTRLSQPTSFDYNLVSHNYFDVLEIPLITMPKNWQSGIVINKAAAELLSNNENINGLLGTSITYHLTQSTHPIVGIVENAPHQGKSKSAKPTFYVPLTAEHAVNRQQFVFHFADTHQQNSVVQNLLTWLTEQSTQVDVLPVSSIEQALSKHDRSNQQLLLFSMFVVCLIVSCVLVSLWYQIRAYIALEKQRLGVFLALGASDFRVMMNIMAHAMLAFAIAAPMTMFSFNWLINRVNESSKIALTFHAEVFALSSITLLLMLTLSVMIPSIRFTRTPISKILRSE